MFKPLLKILDERANTIQKGLQAAEKSMKDQESLEERARQEHIKAEKRAAAIIDKARAESKELGKQIVEEARAEAQKAVSKQESALLEKLAEEERALEGRLTGLVVATTQAVLRDTLSAGELKSITKKEIAKLKKKS